MRNRTSAIKQSQSGIAPVGGGDQAARILSEQVRLLYRNGLLAQAMVAILSVLLVVVMAEQVNQSQALAWLGYMLVVCMYRLYLDQRYWREKPGFGAAPAWLRRFSLGALLAGLGWAVSSLLFIPGSAQEPQFFAILTLVGVAVGALPILSSVLRVYLVYAGLILLPLVVILYLQPGSTYAYIALAGVLFMFGLGRSAHTIHHTLEETLRERFSRETANAAMEKAYAELRQVNQRLSAEVSQRLMAEAGLRQARDAAEAANQAKSAFLANMSHELRTPMNGILGMTELALSTNLDKSQREYLEIALDSASRLLQLINDLIDTACLDAGRLQLLPRPVNLAEVLNRVIKRKAMPAREKGLALDLRLDPCLDDEVHLDPDALDRVLDNLLDNAVKFTDHGQVQVQADRQHCPDGRPCLHICVSDTGIGIAFDRLASIFDLFTQADSSSTRRHGGTGLGLGLASRLVALMHGQIWVQSEPGQGSHFHLLLPTRPGVVLGGG